MRHTEYNNNQFKLFVDLNWLEWNSSMDKNLNNPKL